MTGRPDGRELGQRPVGRLAITSRRRDDHSRERDVPGIDALPPGLGEREPDDAQTVPGGRVVLRVTDVVDRASGVDVVAAYGGDGTVMEVVNGLIGSDVPLGILPGGTGDILSVELQIPQTLEESAKLVGAADPRIRSLDVGKCGDRHFLLRLSTGLSARQIGMATREMRDQYGKLAYLIAALRALPSAKPARFHFTLDGQERDF